MTLTGAIIAFIILWWLSFFVVLPIGVQSQFEDDSTIPGTEAGAPKQPMLQKKAMWATWAAAGITTLLVAVTRFVDVQTLVVGG